MAETVLASPFAFILDRPHCKQQLTTAGTALALTTPVQEWAARALSSPSRRRSLKCAREEDGAPIGVIGVQDPHPSRRDDATYRQRLAVQRVDWVVDRGGLSLADLGENLGRSTDGFHPMRADYRELGSRALVPQQADAGQGPRDVDRDKRHLLDEQSEDLLPIFRSGGRRVPDGRGSPASCTIRWRCSGVFR